MDHRAEEASQPQVVERGLEDIDEDHGIEKCKI